jgi:FAD/FMN-containing dehydrogenase
MLCAPESPLARWHDEPLARRVRDAFDPHRVMNRGVLPSAA